MGSDGHYTDEWERGFEGVAEPEAGDADALVSQPRARERPFPPGLPIVPGRRRRGIVHGFHANSSIALTDPLGCDVCVLSAIRKKNARHPLACKEAKKHARCSILERHQTNWAAGLVDEIRTATGHEPTAIQRSQIEQILRLRGRIFALETYVAAAGVVDVRSGEPRAIIDRMTSLENSLARATGELRASIAEVRDRKRGPTPSLSEYLEALANAKAAPLAIEEDGSKANVSEEQSSFTPEVGSGDNG